MKEARLSLPPGSKPVLDPPDPLTFWNIQVCNLIELSLPTNITEVKMNFQISIQGGMKRQSSLCTIYEVE